MLRALLLILSGVVFAAYAPPAQAQGEACPLSACALAAFPALAPTVLAGGDEGAALLAGATGSLPGELPLVPLGTRLSAEQEALLGCGPYWGTECEVDGIDLLNADAGVLQQAWVGFEGAYRPAYVQGGFGAWSLANGQPQPGTLGFAPNPPQPGTLAFPPDGPQPGTLGFAASGRRLADARYLDASGHVPGARGPLLEDGVPPSPDFAGSTPGLVVPVQLGVSAGQRFVNEMAALSFNLQLLLVAFSSGGTGAPGDPGALDPSNPYALYDPNDPSTAGAAGRCSFLQPQYCSSVQAFFEIVGAPPPDPRAGGNGSFGRRDFVWHTGTRAGRPLGCLAVRRVEPSLSAARGGPVGAGRPAGRCPAR